MSNSSRQQSGNKPIFNRMFLFPIVILVIYAVLFVISPGKVGLAIKSSGNVFLSMIIPLSLVFVIMLLINLFLKPASVAKFLGKGSRVKGIALSAAAGIVSTGPIYAWYPLLKDLKEKGAGDSSIAIFLYNRAVKPFLLPVMVTYFGWLYVVTLIILTILASVVVGFSVSIFSPTKRK
ncbi:permease [Chloroflexota bacterium]